MFDNLSKFLAQQYSQDFASWFIGKPIKLTELKPTELALEPIRADMEHSVIYQFHPEKYCYTAQFAAVQKFHQLFGWGYRLGYESLAVLRSLKRNST